MASTHSGDGKKSRLRQTIHINTTGSMLTTLCGRGERAYTIEARNWATCARCKKLAEKLLASP